MRFFLERSIDYDELRAVRWLKYLGVDLHRSREDGQTPLMRAAEAGALDIVQYLIKHGANLNGVDHDGGTPLMYAANQGHRLVVEYLVSQGAIIGAQAYNGTTSLLCAARHNHLEVLDYLIQHGADVNLADRYGRTSLMCAVQYGHHRIAHRLIAWGACFEGLGLEELLDIGASDFSNAIAEGRLEDAERLFENHAIDINQVNVLGQTPLMRAVVNGQLEAVRWLLSKNVEINQASYHHLTALYFGVRAYLLYHEDDPKKLSYEAILRAMMDTGLCVVDDATQAFLNEHTTLGMLDAIFPSTADTCFVLK